MNQPQLSFVLTGNKLQCVEPEHRPIQSPNCRNHQSRTPTDHMQQTDTTKEWKGRRTRTGHPVGGAGRCPVGAWPSCRRQFVANCFTPVVAEE